jgi:SAM-dependent methyltransferase
MPLNIFNHEVPMSEIPNYEQAKQYFEERLNVHGATARGVDWNSETAQEIRFSQLARVIDPSAPFSLLDYGSGYGALAGYLLRRGLPMQQYTGYDILESMVVKAREVFADQAQCAFTHRFEDLAPVDYAIASGIFNLKLDTPYGTWTNYVVHELEKMHELSHKGFSANFLTKYSDPEYMRPNLYYADPCFLFDYCKVHFSRNVALLHDYEVYDFTLIVRK